MDFSFSLNDIFKSNISIINSSLLPSDFSGDRRHVQQCTSKIAEIIDTMGIASAKAQDLQTPNTSSEKMKNSDHTLYLMIIPEENNGKGSVVGMLKVGMKNLFLFDETGMVHERMCLCILDFYVHELKQRTGFGKKLYDYMLLDKNIEPCKLAIDNPSGKCLSFLHKHYGLSRMFPQNNNYVVFEGFFYSKTDLDGSLNKSSPPLEYTEKDDRNAYDNHSVSSNGYKPQQHGRHTAFKPHDTMGQCLEWITPPHTSRQFPQASIQFPQATIEFPRVSSPHQMAKHSDLW